MKKLIAAVALLITAIIPAQAGEGFATMLCSNALGESFMIWARGDKVTVQWGGEEYPAEGTVSDNKLYVMQKGSAGTIAIMFDFKVNSGLTVTEFNDGQVSKHLIKCSIN